MGKRIKPKLKVADDEKKRYAIDVLLSIYLPIMSHKNSRTAERSIDEIKLGWYELFDEGYLMLAEDNESVLMWNVNTRKYVLINASEMIKEL
jgi:hypothetical protein